LKPKEKFMTTDVKLAKQAIHDKLESRIKTVEAKLSTLKTHAETAKANVELKSIAELLPKNQMMQQMLQGLKKSEGSRWEQAKAEIEEGIDELEKSAKEIEARAKQN
jgi:uncharacterized protein involved in exopolysaccharide biosynthesis